MHVPGIGKLKMEVRNKCNIQNWAIRNYRFPASVWGAWALATPQNGQHSWTLDEEHSREIIQRGLELGVNFFDTAIGYQSGTSEQYLGRALRDFAKRDEWWWPPNFCPAPRTKSTQASPASSTSNRW